MSYIKILNIWRVMRKSKEDRCHRSDDSPACVLCKTRALYIGTTYVCYKGHFLCNSCLRSLFASDTELVCPKCSQILEQAHKLRKSQAKINSQNVLCMLGDKYKRYSCENERNFESGDHKAQGHHRLHTDKVTKRRHKNLIIDPSTGHNNPPCCENCDEKYERLVPTVSRSMIGCHSKEAIVDSSKSTLKKSSSTTNNSRTSTILHSCRRYSVPARPINCPISECGKVVAATGYISHFQFDHPVVSLVEVFAGIQYTIILNPDQIVDETMGCVCVFTLATVGQAKFETYSHTDCTRVEPTQTILIPFSMMISKIYTKFSMDKDRYGVRDMNKYNAFEYPRPKSLIKKQWTGNEELGFIVMWICGFDTSPQVYYSLEATYNNCRSKACIYTGPTLSLSQYFTPRDLFRTGNCLILSPGLTETLTEDTGTIDINVRFH